MKSTILQHYYNKIRVILLRKNNYINTHQIPYILNTNLYLDANFQQNSILEKKRLALLIEFNGLFNPENPGSERKEIIGIVDY